MQIHLDIETHQTDREDVRQYIAATVTHPGTMSKAETIAKWNEECRPAAIEEAVSKTGLDGAFGRVCVIGVALDDGPVITFFNATEEASILDQLAGHLEGSIHATEFFKTTVVGHNVANFDLRFLTQRYIVNGIRPPQVLARAAQAKPWESEKVFDTMVQWAGVGNRISLDKLCLALSIPSPKGDMDGSMVGQYVADGRIEEVAAYCQRDVEATRAVYKRMTFA
jgi:3'-5' exonuclease